MEKNNQFSLKKEEYLSGWINAYKNNPEADLWNMKPIKFLPDYISIFQENNVKRILDACCGDGRNSMYLLNNGFDVMGFDLSPEAAERANYHARESGFNNGFFLQADIENLPQPFVGDMFDTLVCLDAVGQFMYIDKAMERFKIIVKAGGYLLINYYTQNDASYGEGRKIDDKTFLYNDTLFRYFNEEDVKKYSSGFEILDLKICRWDDPPHPGYRDYPHTHESIVVLLEKNHL